MGLCGICEVLILFFFGYVGVYDFEDDVIYLFVEIIWIIDLGDVDIVYIDMIESYKCIEFGVRKILVVGVLLVVLGGDYLVNIFCINVFDGEDLIYVVQIDVYFDFVDEWYGVWYGYGNLMWCVVEKFYVMGLSQIGI